MIGASGQMLQNFEHLRLNVRPPPAMSAWRSFERSHLRKVFSCFAVLSSLCVVVALQDLQSQRCDPAAVLPFRTILPPHTGHLMLFMPVIQTWATFRGILWHLIWGYA